MSTSLLEELKLDTWNPALTAAAQAVATDALEAGRLLYLPRLGLALLPNPQGKPRAWRVGEPSADRAARFHRRARRAWPGEARLLRALRVTKRRRSEYDHLMLQLHDRVKADASYQQQAPQGRIDFPVGSTWIVFSDQVLHAAMSGQFVMEETLMLPVSGMRAPETSPIRVLERMTGQRLA